MADVDKICSTLLNLGLKTVDDNMNANVVHYWKPSATMMDAKSAIVVMHLGTSPMITINPFFMKPSEILKSEHLSGDEQLTNYVYMEDYTGTPMHDILLRYCDKCSSILPVVNYMYIFGKTRFSINHLSLSVFSTYINELIMDTLIMHRNMENSKVIQMIDNF